MRMSTEVLQNTTGVGLSFVVRYVVLILVTGALAAGAAAWAASNFLGVPFWDWFSLFVLGVALIVLGFVLNSSHEVARWLAGMIAEAIEWSRDERTARYSVPAPTLPAPETFKLTAGERVGEDVPKNLLHGFDARDLEWLAHYLANGNRWTETLLEKMPLPYSREKFGKAEGNTPYMRLLGVPDGILLRAGIITGRGGSSNKSGILAVTDATEIIRRVKQLQ